MLVDPAEDCALIHGPGDPSMATGLANNVHPVWEGFVFE